ncbi:MAG: glycoside hydrolase family 36 protein [Promethearchaeota archaeon]
MNLNKNENLNYSKDNVILEYGSSKIVFKRDNGRFDVITPHFILRNILSSINVAIESNSKKIMNNSKLNRRISKGAGRLLKKLAIFTPDIKFFNEIKGDNQTKNHLAELKVEEGNFDINPNKIELDNDSIDNLNQKFSIIGSYKIIKVPLDYTNPELSGVFHSKLILCINDGKLFSTNLEVAAHENSPDPSIFFAYLIVDSWEDFESEFNPPKIHSISPILMDENSVISINSNNMNFENLGNNNNHNSLRTLNNRNYRRKIAKDITFFRNGYQSWSVTNLLKYNEKAKLTPTDLGKINLQNQDQTIRAKYFSEMTTAITVNFANFSNDKRNNPKEKSLILGFITHENQFSRILMDKLYKIKPIAMRESARNKMEDIATETAIYSPKLLIGLSQLDGISINNINKRLDPIRSEVICIICSGSDKGMADLHKWAQICGIFMRTNLMKEKIKRLVETDSVVNGDHETPKAFGNSSNLNDDEAKRIDPSVATEKKLSSDSNSLNIGDLLYKKRIEPLIGWCSWYYYYTKITEQEMIKNTNFLAKHREIPLEIIQLDDGYQECIGDYVTINDKFPNCQSKNGLKYLTEIIHEKGFLAGLWIAPFFAPKKSKLYQSHPDWFLKDKKGKLINASFNWGAFQHPLDISIKDALNHIEDLVKKIIYKWEFDFIKIDFIYAPESIKGVFSNPSITRAQLLRKGVETIKKAMRDRILLGCGAPLGPCIGLVDAMRIGGDTAANWQIGGFIGNWLRKHFNLDLPSLKPALLNTILRSFMHNALWINDPDCVVVRKNKSKLTFKEIELQLTIFGLSGGQVFFSDDLEILDKERLDLMPLLVPPYSFYISCNSIYNKNSKYNMNQLVAIPIDGLIRYPPNFYGLYFPSNIGDRIYISIINWSKKPSKLENESITIEKICKALNAEEILENYSYFLLFDFWESFGIKLKSMHKESLNINGAESTGDFNTENKVNSKLKVAAATVKPFIGPIDSITSIPYDVDTEVPPHGCKYFGIIPLSKNEIENSLKIKEPILLGSTLHILQGAVEIMDFKFSKEESKISLTLKTKAARQGTIFILIPSKYILDNDRNEETLNKPSNIVESLIIFNSSILMIAISKEKLLDRLEFVNQIEVFLKEK